MKRALEEYMTTVQVLYDLYMEEFFLDQPKLYSPHTTRDVEGATEHASCL